LIDYNNILLMQFDRAMRRGGRVEVTTLETRTQWRNEEEEGKKGILCAHVEYFYRIWKARKTEISKEAHSIPMRASASIPSPLARNSEARKRLRVAHDVNAK